MRLGVWLAFQSTKQARAMLNLAGFGPWNQGLGCVGYAFTRTHKTLIFAHTGFINRTGYFNQLLQPAG